MVKRPPFFYGWVIVVIAIVTGTLVYGVRHSFSVFFPSILDEFEWSRGSTAIMLSLNLLIYGLVAPVAGTLADRWKPKLMMVIGATVIAMAMAGCSLANKLWHFYLLFGVIVPVGTALCGWPLLSPTLMNWFTSRRGLILGLGQMGGGFSFAYGMVAEAMIHQLGWRHAYLALAGILAATLLPLYLLLFHYRPEDKKLKAYGAVDVRDARQPVAGAVTIKDSNGHEWTLRKAMHTHQLWLLVVSQFLYWGIGCYLILAHQVKLAEDAGYGSSFAVSIFALYGIVMVAGQVSGFISDRIGRERAVTFASLLAISGLAAMISVRDTSSPWLLYTYAICFGYGAGLFSVTIFAGAADIFHGKHYGTISGMLLAGMGAGGAIGPWLGGYLYDTSGSYTSALILCISCIGFASLCFWIAAPRNATKLRAKL